MKLSMIAPATATVAVAGQKVHLKGVELIALEPLLDTGKFSDFLTTPARHGSTIGAPFFAMCVEHEGTAEEAKAFFSSLRATQQIKLLQKCIDLTFPPSEGEDPQPNGSSPSTESPAEGE